MGACMPPQSLTPRTSAIGARPARAGAANVCIYPQLMCNVVMVYAAHRLYA